MTISSKTYQRCHEMMLENPEYTPCENAGLTYILVQISDRNEYLGIQTMLINPAIPRNGSLQSFIKLEDDQQVGVLALTQVAKTVQEAHQLIQKLMEMSTKKENLPEVVRLLGQAFNT